jgi:hypothetical protein
MRKIPTLQLLASAATIAAALTLTGCATPRQVVLDAEVDRLCAVDGGVRVYEKVQLPPAEYAKYISGTKLKSNASQDDLFYYSSEREILSGPTNGDPDGTTITKAKLALMRRADGKTLGANTTYSRRGGDIPLGFHPSVYVCPPFESKVNHQGGIAARVFVKEADNAKH